MALIDVHGSSLEYERAGGAAPADTGPPPLIFLHEGLGSVAAWRDFPARVAATLGRHGLVYSRRGYGRSSPWPRPWPASFMHDEALVVLPALLDALGIVYPVLVGHSDGASIALIHAAAAGRPVRALVLEAPHTVVEERTLESIRDARGRYAGSDFRARWSRTQGPQADALFAAWSEAWLSGAFRSWDIEPLLPRITCPVLVVQGADDPYGTLRHMEAIRDGVAGPVETLLLDHAGHAPHRTRPAETLAAIERFLRARA